MCLPLTPLPPACSSCVYAACSGARLPFRVHLHLNRGTPRTSVCLPPLPCSAFGFQYLQGSRGGGNCRALHACRAASLPSCLPFSISAGRLLPACCLFPCPGARIHHPLVIAACPYLGALPCLLPACYPPAVFSGLQFRLLHLCVRAPVIVKPAASSHWSATVHILTPTLACVILALAWRASFPASESP